MRAKTVINDLIFKVMQKIDLKDKAQFEPEKPKGGSVEGIV